MEEIRKILRKTFRPPLGEDEYDESGYRPLTHALTDDLTVTQVEIYNEHGLVGTDIVPGLSELEAANPDFTDWDRLIWKLAVLRMETGLRFYVDEGKSYTNRVRNNGEYMLYGESWGTSGTFDYLWTLINGIGMGAESMIRKQENEKG